MVSGLPLLLRRRWRDRGYLLADGAMGTRLMAAGLAEGALPERWNRDRAADVVAIHRSYMDAGSDIVLTNSFGGNRARLAMHGAEGELEELNVAAVRCVKRAKEDSGREVVVAGSMGPTGELLYPLGKLSEGDMEAMYDEQACALAKGGADLLWIETQSDLKEMGCAMRAAGKVGLPYSVTGSFDTAGSTMMGVSPEKLVDFCLDIKRSSIGGMFWGMGLNCGLGASDTLLSLRRLIKKLEDVGNRDALAVIVKGNCGVPQWRDGAFRYSGSEALMGEYAILARRLGADVVGLCCGSGGEHMKTMGERLAGGIGDDSVPSEEEIERIVGKAEGAKGGEQKERRRKRREK